jgi:trigger factor
METVVAPLEGNKIKLTVTIDEQEFEKALDATYRKMARDVKVPGFRPGKVPRRILESRLGPEMARAEAIRGSLAGYYNEAIREHDVDAIAPPQIDITAGEHEGPVSFDAIVEVRPQIQLAGYGGLRVTIPSPALTDDDVSAQLDKLRTNDGVLTAVDRPARTGDQVTIDVKVTRSVDPDQDDGDNERTTEDLLYEVGSGTLGSELDDQLLGASAGDVVHYEMEIPDVVAASKGEEAPPRQLSYEVLVKDVKEMVLPEVTDEWASEASEFDTVDELMADITKRLTVVKRAQAQVALRSQAIEAIAELVQDDAPEPLINEEITHRAHELENALKQQGLGIGQYLQATGRSQQQLLEELRGQAVQAVKADLALRALADIEDIEVGEADVDAEIGRLADRFEVSPADVREQLESSEQMAAVRSDVRRGMAIEWLVAHIEAVDPEGQLIDRALLDEPPEEASSPDAADNQDIEIAVEPARSAAEK